MSQYAPPIPANTHDPHDCFDTTHKNCMFVKAWWKINRALKEGRRVAGYKGRAEIYD